MPANPPSTAPLAMDPEPLVATGRVTGEIARVPAGQGGFGFDPVLYLPELDKTFAEISADEKNRRSHRGQAARALAALLRSQWLTVA